MKWETVSLKEIATIRGGGRLKLSSKDFVANGTPAYGAGGHNGDVAVTESPEPSVILSSIGARCGKCFLPEGPWTTLANTQIITPDQSRVDVRFLWYQLNDELSWHRSGTGQPFIKPSDVKSRKVSLPPLEEQRRIAAILDQADAIRTKRRVALASFGDLRQAVFQEMVARLQEGEGPSSHYFIRDLIGLRSGNFLPAKRRDGGAIPVYGANGVIGYHSEATHMDPRIIIGRVGACGSVHLTQGPVWVTDNALIVSKKVEGLDDIFLADALARADLGQYANRSAQPQISAARLASVRLQVPPRSVQKLYRARVESITASHGRVAQALEADDELFSSLQSRAFRGEL